MRYKKGDIISGYRVSLPIKEKEGVETYRVRDTAGSLFILKLHTTEAERNHAERSPLFIEKGEGFVVYRHVAGETLAARIVRLGRLPVAEAQNITLDILRQLEALHASGIIHSNLHSDNIMLELSSGMPRGWIVGYGKVHTSGQCEDNKTDLRMAGELIYEMRHGERYEDSVKIRAEVGKPELIDAAMLKAISGEFENATSMTECLNGNADSMIPNISKGPGFRAVAGMSELKNQLRSEVIDILRDRDEAKRYGIDIPNGILLYGPPGCGKTFLAARFAEEAGYNYIYVKTSDLASTYIHGSQEKIGALFAAAKKNSPTILCFDEFDALVPRRDSINNASQSGEVNEFLSQLNNCGKDGVFVIATTNRPDLIDPAALRSGRFDYMVYVPLPDYDSRREIFRIMLADRPCGDDLDLDRLAQLSDGYLASDIAAVVQQSARLAFKEKSPISARIIETTIKTRKPSLGKNEIANFERIRANFEGKNKDEGTIRVGFLHI